MSKTSTIDLIQGLVQDIADGKHKTLVPGARQDMPVSASVNDMIAQGDLNIIVMGTPDQYEAGAKLEVPDTHEKPKQLTKQLVLGNTIGAKHALAHLDGVEMYTPKNWSEDSIAGPIVVFHEANEVVHPTHGDVGIPKGFAITFIGQREWDKEQAAERRARD